MVDTLFSRIPNTPAVNDTLTAAQLGGSVTFASGHIKHFLVQNEGFPAPGKRYLLFLWSDDFSGTHYQITASYLINQGKLYSLRDATQYAVVNGLSLQSFRSRMSSR